MAVTLNASTSTGLVQSADTSGIITLQNNGTNALTVNSGNLQFNSGYGSVVTAYGCRAWANFNGNDVIKVTGTYSRSGTTVTVTATAHGYSVGQQIYADFTSGTAVDGAFTIATVTDANTFTFTHGTSGTTSGNITTYISYSYSRTGTTVTVTSTNHDYQVGHLIYADFTSGTSIADGVFTIATVPDANSFTFTHGTSGSTSGNVMFPRCPIRASGNIAHVSFLAAAGGTAGSYGANFTNALPDANYAGQVTSERGGYVYIDSQTTKYIRPSFTDGAGGGWNVTTAQVSIIR